jgi:glyoxylase-like metal-dependent hydrolase (beta-lactamase superfamily II)
MIKRSFFTPFLSTCAALAAAAVLFTAGPESAQAQQKQKAKAATPASVPDEEIHIQPIQGNIYMLVGAGANVVVSVGRDGILLVDAGSAAMSTKLHATVLQLATALTAAAAPNRCVGLHCPQSPFGWTSPSLNSIISSPAPAKPVRYIIDTTLDADHTGGNQVLAKLPEGTKIVGVTFPPVAVAPSAIILSHENIQNRMSQPEKGDPVLPAEAWPTESFHQSSYKLSQFFNGEGVQVFHAPNAHTDGDSFVYFRYSDVIAAGDLINTESYPVIDLAHGGSLNGILDGINHILDLSIPEFRSQGGTMIVPGHGRLCDIGDVANYRNMVAIVRDRIQNMIGKGMTLAQVKAAKPTMDYDGLYGSTTGSWTTDKFIEAAYQSLSQKK